MIYLYTEEVLNMSKKIEEPIDINKIDKEIEQVESIETIESDLPFKESIEKERVALYERYVKQKRISNIIMLITVVLVIGCFILISQQNPALMITGYVLAGLVIVGMIVYYVLTRNKLPDATKTYIKFITTRFNAHNYDSPEFTDVKCDHDEKLELADFISDKVHLNPNQVTSRNVVRGKYNGHNFLCADAALYSGSGKTRNTQFVGKYLTIGNDLHFEGRIVLVSKLKEGAVDLPTAIDDLVKLNEDELFEIYGAEGVDYNAVLGKDFISLIKKIVPAETLLNLVVVVWAGRTSIYASYSDPVMVLPFEKEFNAEAMDVFKKQQKELFSASVKLFEK